MNPVSDTFSESVPIIKELIEKQQKENPQSNFYMYCTGKLKKTEQVQEMKQIAH